MAETFNAGTVYADSRLNRDQFQRDITWMRNQLREFARESVVIKVKLEYWAQLTALRTRLEALSGTVKVKLRLEAASVAAVRTTIQGIAGTVRIKLRIERGAIAALRTQIAALGGAVRIRLIVDAQSIADLRARLLGLDLRVRVRVDLDESSVAAIRARIASLGGDVSIGMNFGKFMAGFKILKLALLGLAIPVALGGLIQILGAIGAGAVAAAGALWALPAVLGAIGVSVLALKLGFQGMGDAMSAADPAALQAALEKLAPAAREVVIAVRGFKDEWKELQQSVQQNLFAGIATHVEELGNNYLPMLKTRLSGVATGWNLVMHSALDALNQRQSIDDTNTGLLNTELMLRNASAAGGNLVEAFRDIMVVGSEFLPGLGEGLTNITEKFKVFIAGARESGQLKIWIEQGIIALRQLGELIGNVAGIIGSVFQAANAAGGGFLETMVQVTGTARDFLTTGPGFDAMVAIFKAISDTVVALTPGIVALGTAIAEGIMILAPILPVVGKAFSDILVAVSPLIPVFSEIFGVLAGAFAEALIIVAPLIKVVAELLGEVLLAALDAIKPLIPIFADIMRDLVPPLTEVAEVLAEGLITAIDILAPYLPPLVKAFGEILNAVIPLIPPLLEVGLTILNAILPFLPQLIGLFLRLVNEAIVPLLPPMLRLAETVLPLLVDAMNFLLPIIIDFGNYFIDKLVPIINDDVIPAIEGLIGFINDAKKNFEETKARIEADFELLKGIFTDATAIISKTWNDFWNGNQEKSDEINRNVSNAWIEFWGGVKIEQDGSQTAVRGKWNDFWIGNQEKSDEINANIAAGWVSFWGGVKTEQDGSQTTVKGSWQTFWDGTQRISDDINKNIAAGWVSFWGGVKTEQDGSQTVVEGSWGTFWGNLRDTGERVGQAIQDGIGVALNFIRDSFSSAIAFIENMWNRLKGIAAAPVNFVIREVYNNGIKKAWDVIADWTGLPKLPIANEVRFAQGGFYDAPHTAQIARAGAMRVWAEPETGGEAYIPLAQSKRSRSTGVLSTVANQFGLRLTPLSSDEGKQHGPIYAFAKGGMLQNQVTHFMPDRIDSFADSGLWRQMFGIVKNQFPTARLSSAYRPGSTTAASGNASYHSRGNAVDLAGPRSMDTGTMSAMNKWIANNFANSSELIYTPGINLNRGKPHTYAGVTRQMHYDHVHWAMQNAGMLGGAKGNYTGGADGGGGFLDVLGSLGSMFAGARGAMGGFFGAMGKTPLTEVVNQFPLTVIDKVIGWAVQKAKDTVGGLWNGLMGMFGGGGGDGGGQGTGDQVSNARIIGGVARSMGFGRRGVVVALATALQESGLRNINYGDRDSVGLFQQRPSQGWGSVAQIMNPQYSSRKFFEGLRRVSGWEGMPITVAAQKVQRSAFPGAYAKHEGLANRLASQVGFDSGGYLSPGPWNGTKRPEPVFTDGQWSEISTLAGRGVEATRGGGVNQNFYITAPPDVSLDDLLSRTKFTWTHANRGVYT